KRSLLRTLAQARSRKMMGVALSLMRDPELSEDAASVLVSIGRDCVRIILPSLLSTGQLRADLLQVIRLIGRPAVAELIVVLEDDNVALHRPAIYSLSELGGAASEQVIDVFYAGDAGVRGRAQEVLVLMRESAVPALVGAVLRGDATIQSNALEC